jgi:hypothetical protein
MIELYEEDIEDWYMNHSDIPIQKFLCEDIILKNNDKNCLNEKEESIKNKKNEL